MIGAATCSGTKRALQTREKPECFLTVTEVELCGECPNYELLLVYCLYCPTQVNAYLVVKVDTLYPADAFFWLAITVAPCALTIKKKKIVAWTQWTACFANATWVRIDRSRNSGGALSVRPIVRSSNLPNSADNPPDCTNVPACTSPYSPSNDFALKAILIILLWEFGIEIAFAFTNYGRILYMRTWRGNRHVWYVCNDAPRVSRSTCRLIPLHRCCVCFKTWGIAIYHFWTRVFPYF